MTALPLPGEHDWALKLNNAIEQRGIEITQDLQNAIDTLAGAVGDEYTPRAEFNPVKAAVETGRLSEAELKSTIAAAIDTAYPAIDFDTDGVPYFIPGRGGIAIDIDGRPYVQIGA